MANILLWLTSGNTSLKILRPDYTKRNTEIDTTVIRGSESYRCATEKKRTGHILDCKTIKSLNMFNDTDDFVFFVFLHTENLGTQIRWNRMSKQVCCCETSVT